MYGNVKEYPDILALAKRYAMADSRIRCDDLADSINRIVERLNVISDSLRAGNERVGKKALDQMEHLINTLWCAAILEGFTNGFLTCREIEP